MDEKIAKFTHFSEKISFFFYYLRHYLSILSNQILEISISYSNVQKNCLNKPQNDQKCENGLYGFWLLFTINVFLLICIEIKVSEIEILSEILEELDVDNKMFTIFGL